MVGNTLTGDTGRIRGIPAGGLPWILDRGRATLYADGRLKIRVRGLVIADDADREDLHGTNPVLTFRGRVSCLTPDGDGHVIVNEQTEAFEAPEEGDARVDDTVALPEPCLAPLVFVTHPNGAWFAVGGL